MKIALVFAGMLLACGLTGALLVQAARARALLGKFSFHIGYAYTLVGFYAFYALLHRSRPAMLCTVALPVIAAGASWLFVRWRRRGTPSAVPAAPAGEWLAAARRGLPSFSRMAILLLLLAGWPYFASGWGNYWHSGNYDMEDGLNGRDAYIESRIFNTADFDVGNVISDRSWFDFAKASNTLSSHTWEMNSYRKWYASDGFRLQYSSVAFWSEFFSVRYGLDVLLIQSLLNLVLMAFGLALLARDAFGLGPRAAEIAATVAVGSQFYLTSYVSGHVGSLMYGSLLPMLLYAFLAGGNTRRDWVARAALGGIAVLAIAYTYTHPLAIIAVPLAAYWLYSQSWIQARWTQGRAYFSQRPVLLVLGAAVGLVLVYLFARGLWDATESYRHKAAGQYRAWGYTHDWLIVPLFIGFIMPPLEGIVFAGSMLSPQTYVLLSAGAIGAAAILTWWFFAARPARNPRFFVIFGLCWIIEGLVFKYFIVDSYYFYKFLYTHHFVLVLGVACYVAQSRSQWVRWFVGALLAVNLWGDVRLGVLLATRPFNESPARYRGLLSADRHVLGESFVEVTGGDATAVRQTLAVNHIEQAKDPRTAEFLVTRSGPKPDITGLQFPETLADTGGLALRRIPENNYLMIRTVNEPESQAADPTLGNSVFRWVGQMRMDYLAIYVVRPKLTAEMKGKYLRICFEKGPSASGDIPVSVSAPGQVVLGQVVLSSGVQCLWLPAEQVLAAEQPLMIHSGATGRSLLPHDDRILLYRVFAIGWTDRIYDDQALGFLNRPAADIVTRSPAADRPRVQLGAGWAAYETFGGENFRWVGGPAELLVQGGDTDGIARVTLELEPGPSLGLPSLQLEVLDARGDAVALSTVVTGRDRISLSLPSRRHETSLYRLRAASRNLPVPGEQRLLNYRVFHLDVAPDKNDSK